MLHLLSWNKKIISYSSVFFFIFYYSSWAGMTHDTHPSTAWSWMQQVLPICAPRLGCPHSALHVARMRSPQTWSYHSVQNLQTDSATADSLRLLVPVELSLHPYTFGSGLRLRSFFTLSSLAALCSYRFQPLYWWEVLHGILWRRQIYPPAHCPAFFDLNNCLWKARFACCLGGRLWNWYQSSAAGVSRAPCSGNRKIVVPRDAAQLDFYCRSWKLFCPCARRRIHCRSLPLDGRHD